MTEKTIIESAKDHELEQIIGEHVLQMIDGLIFTPDLHTSWDIEIADISYEITVKRSPKIDKRG